MSSNQLPPCDEEILKHGQLLCRATPLISLKPKHLEEFCQRMTEASNHTIRFDWHYVGGKPCVLFIGGDRSRAIEVCKTQLEWLQSLPDSVPRRPSMPSRNQLLNEALNNNEFFHYDNVIDPGQYLHMARAAAAVTTVQ